MSEALSGPAERHLLARGWGLYLLVAAVLVAFVAPEATSQTQVVYIDPLNAAAVAVFLVAILVYRIPVRLHFALPILLILTGTAFAFTNSPSVISSVLVIVKEAYLYIWFLVLVTLMCARGDLKGIRLVWLWTALLIALVVVVQVVSRPGFSAGDLFIRWAGREKGTFANENMFVDYLMFSVFILLGFAGQVRWWFFASSLALLSVAVLTTKSNGGLVSLLTGFMTWVLALAWAQSVRWARLVGGLAFGLAVVAVAVWFLAESGLGYGPIKARGAQNLLGPMGKSAEIRGRIRQGLLEGWMHTPMGVGPGSIAVGGMRIGGPEKDPGGFTGKQDRRRAWPHNDYLSYLVERGPVALLGLLLCIGQAFGMVLRSRQRLSNLVGSARAGNALWAAFLGALTATSVHSLVIDKVHFRHFWLFLAILTAMTSVETTVKRTAVAPISPRTPDPASEAGIATELKD
jgi:O-antigen ligase